MDKFFLKHLDKFETRCKLACDQSEFIDRENAAMIVALMDLTAKLSVAAYWMEQWNANYRREVDQEAAEKVEELLKKVAEYEQRMP